MMSMAKRDEHGLGGADNGKRKEGGGGGDSQTGEGSEGSATSTAANADAALLEGQGERMIAMGDGGDSNEVREFERMRLRPMLPSHLSRIPSNGSGVSCSGEREAFERFEGRILKLRRVAQLRRMGKPLEALLLSQQQNEGFAAVADMSEPRANEELGRLLDLHALVEQGLCYHNLQRPGESETCFNSVIMQCQAMRTARERGKCKEDGVAEVSMISGDSRSTRGDTGSPHRYTSPCDDNDDASEDKGRSHSHGERSRDESTRGRLLDGDDRGSYMRPDELQASALAGLASLRRDNGQLAEAASLLSHARSMILVEAGGDDVQQEGLSRAPAEADSSRGCPADAFDGKGVLSLGLEAPVGAAEVRAQAAGVLSDLGTTLKIEGSVDEAMAKYMEALAIDNTHSSSFYNAGVLYGEMGQDEQAMLMYERAVSLRPMYPEAICNMGVIHKSRGRLHEALQCYERCLSVSPNFTLAKCNAAIALCDLATQMKAGGKFNDAVLMYEKALSLHPQYSEGYYNFAVALAEAGKTDAAIIMYEAALRNNPGCAEAHNNLGVIFKDRDNFDKAEECYIAALKIKPAFPQPMNNLGVIYTCQGRISEALRVFKCATETAPWYSEAYNNLGVLYRDVGMINEAIEAYDSCLKIEPTARNAGQNRLLALNYIYSGKERIVSEAHREWGHRFSELQGADIECDGKELGVSDPKNGQGDRGRALVVGYISPDLFVHSVSYFIEAPLRCHNPERVQVIVYNATPRHDGKTATFRSIADEKGWLWRDVHGKTEREIAQMVRGDGVDIFVELTGHTANNKLGVLCHRAAPVQVTWIGYPNSTGLEQCDYRITDSIADPLETEQTYVESLYRLPKCFLCYTPTSEGEAGAIDPLPALRNGYITFGSFNNLAKMTPEVFRLWAKVLSAVPNSNLLIKGKALACASVVARVQQYFIENGVSPARIDTMPLIPMTGSHLQVYSRSVDISIDTFPYGGTTTTCESMYMGVPCITLRGDCHAQNVGASLLTSVGLDDWIANTEQEYVDIAKAASSDLGSLAALRAGLRERLLSSDLCNGKEFVDSLEDAYDEMYELKVGRASSEPAGGRRPDDKEVAPA